MANYTVPKEIDFPRYNMKCSGENVVLHGIFHVISRKYGLLFGQCTIVVFHLLLALLSTFPCLHLLKYTVFPIFVRKNCYTVYNSVYNRTLDSGGGGGGGIL